MGITHTLLIDQIFKWQHPHPGCDMGGYASSAQLSSAQLKVLSMELSMVCAVGGWSSVMHCSNKWYQQVETCAVF
jgi:hypothetical protein